MVCEVGTSLIDEEKSVMEKAESLGKKLLLPVGTTLLQE